MRDYSLCMTLAYGLFVFHWSQSDVAVANCFAGALSSLFALFCLKAQLFVFSQIGLQCLLSMCAVYDESANQHVAEWHLSIH